MRGQIAGPLLQAVGVKDRSMRGTQPSASESSQRSAKMLRLALLLAAARSRHEPDGIQCEIFWGQVWLAGWLRRRAALRWPSRR